MLCFALCSVLLNMVTAEVSCHAMVIRVIMQLFQALTLVMMIYCCLMPFGSFYLLILFVLVLLISVSVPYPDHKYECAFTLCFSWLVCSGSMRKELLTHLMSAPSESSMNEKSKELNKGWVWTQLPSSPGLYLPDSEPLNWRPHVWFVHASVKWIEMTNQTDYEAQFKLFKLPSILFKIILYEMYGFKIAGLNE